MSYALGSCDPVTGQCSGGFSIDPYQQAGFGPVQFTGQFAYPNVVGLQLSVGEVIQDFGEWIKTQAGELLRVVVDEAGRRIVQKTGELLAASPLGPSTAYNYGRNQLAAVDWTPILLGGAVLAAALLLRR